jgi:[ribosomal protein S18]-alanine N-acetyltransferase
VRRAEAVARRRGCGYIGLEVRADNAPARALYAGLGYAEERRLPRYYEDGADALRLHRGI